MKLKDDAVFAVGAEEAGNPAALAVVEWRSGVERAIVHSLFVAAPYRRRGLASGLMYMIREMCGQRSIHRLQLVYYSGKPGTAALESWLMKQGWTAPRTEAVVYHIDRRIGEAPWLRERALPTGVRLIRWTDIPEEEHRRLAAGALRQVPDFLSPYKTFAALEPMNSLGLMAESGIVGWSIAYRLRQDTILYDAIYVHPDYQHTGLAIALLARGISLHLEHVDRIPCGMCVVNRSTPGMFRLAARWLAPYAARMSDKRRCELHLRDG